MMDFMSEVRAKIASHPFKPICIEAQTRKKANARANKKWNAKNPGYNAKKKREAYWKLTEEERKEFNRQKRERMKARHGEDYYKKASKKYRESDRGKKTRSEYRATHKEQNKQHVQKWKEAHKDELKERRHKYYLAYREKLKQKKEEQNDLLQVRPSTPASGIPMDPS